MGVRGQIQYLSMAVHHKLNFFYVLNCTIVALKLCPIQFLLLEIVCRAIFDKVLQNPILLLSFEMFDGKHLKSLLKIWI